MLPSRYLVTSCILGPWLLPVCVAGRVVVKAFPPTSTPLEALEEEERLYTESLNGGLSVENNLLFVAPGSSPFALSRDVTQGTEGLEGEDQEGFDSTFEVSTDWESVCVCVCVCVRVCVCV